MIEVWKEEKKGTKMSRQEREIAAKVTFQNYAEVLKEYPGRHGFILEVLMDREVAAKKRGAPVPYQEERVEILKHFFSHGLDPSSPWYYRGCSSVHQFLCFPPDQQGVEWLRAGFQAGLDPNTVIGGNPVLYEILQDVYCEAKQAQIARLFLEFGFIPVPGTESMIKRLRELWIRERNRDLVFLERFVESIPK